jgi:hypothetical protein
MPERDWRDACTAAPLAALMSERYCPRMNARANLGRAWLLAALAAAGCLDALPPDGSARCAIGPQICPTNYYCAGNNTCWRLGHAPDLSIPHDLAARSCADAGDCGVVADACNDAPTCESSFCVLHPKANGTICAATTNACQEPGRCTDGVCGTITTAKDGTDCTMPTNPCHAPGKCKSGVCGAETVYPDGHQYDTSSYIFRCCGGQPARLDQSPNCGACGIQCHTGFGCTQSGSSDPRAWWCQCGGINNNCFSNCCTVPDNLCSPSNCQTPATCVGCPAGSICEAADPHYFCHY